MIQYYKQEIEKVRNQLIDHLKDTKFFKIINSIPGFGEFSTTLFLVKVGHITRFNERKQFISFIGIDSVTSQSGVSAYHGSISKTGNKLELFYLILLQLYFKYELVVIKPILFICFSEKNNLKASIIINA